MTVRASPAEQSRAVSIARLASSKTMSSRASLAGEPSGPERGPSAAVGGSRRLFFALWPAAPQQSELEAAANAALAAVRGGRRVARESLHLTLSFLGSVPQAAVASVRECAHSVSEVSGVALPGLEVALDALEWWPRPRVLCATASRDPEAAAELARTLEDALCDAGFGPDLKPFRAHVTLMRQLGSRSISRQDAAALRMSPVVWTFSDFALVESRPGPEGSVYSVLESWPLCRA